MSIKDEQRDLPDPHNSFGLADRGLARGFWGRKKGRGSNCERAMVSVANALQDNLGLLEKIVGDRAELELTVTYNPESGDFHPAIIARGSKGTFISGHSKSLGKVVFERFSSDEQCAGQYGGHNPWGEGGSASGIGEAVRRYCEETGSEVDPNHRTGEIIVRDYPED